MNSVTYHGLARLMTRTYHGEDLTELGQELIQRASRPPHEGGGGGVAGSGHPFASAGISRNGARSADASVAPTTPRLSTTRPP